MVLNRVTRLGECLPNGWLLTSGRYLKISEVSYLFELLYSIIKFKHEIGPKNGLGNIMGDVFHKLIWSPWFWTTTKGYSHKSTPCFGSSHIATHVSKTCALSYFIFVYNYQLIEKY
jgi:hypothetical protein